jgi:hypothetical protein
MGRNMAHTLWTTRLLIAAFAFSLLLAGPADAQVDPAIQLGLAHALDGDGSGCSPAELRGIVQKADVKTLGMIGNSRVILAAVYGSCICGNVNCPFVALRLDGTRSSVLLNTYAYAVAPSGKQLPLPNLREAAHDSALVSIATTDAYRDGKYVAIDTQRVRGDNGESKPDTIPVHFAPGTSSAVVHGRISAGWYDQYTFDAAAGQRITVTGPDALEYSLSVESSDKPIALLPAHPATLPRSGRYRLMIESDDQAEQSYRATITIR